METEYISPSYAKKLGISVCSINQIKTLIYNDIKLSIEHDMLVNKQCFHIIGPAGIGKTQITYQMADQLSKSLNRPFEIKMIKSPVLSRDDFIIPFPSKNHKTFEMLYSQFIPKDPDSFGIFVIDEFLRGDQQLQQLMWQIQNENKIHTHDFPKGWFVISIDNPDNDEYNINNMEDAAGLRRSLHLYTSVNVKDFLKYAKDKNYHRLVIDYIEKNPGKLYDFNSQKKGMVYSNPASWDKVSDHLKKYDSIGIIKYINLIQHLINGLLNTYVSADFIHYIKNAEHTFGGDDVVNTYPDIRNEILSIINLKDNASLHRLLNSVFDFLINFEKPFEDNQNDNIIQYLKDLPKDISASFVIKMGEYDKTSPEYIKLILLITTLIAKDKEFNELFIEQFNKLF